MNTFDTEQQTNTARSDHTPLLQSSVASIALLSDNGSGSEFGISEDDTTGDVEVEILLGDNAPHRHLHTALPSERPPAVRSQFKNRQQAFSSSKKAAPSTRTLYQSASEVLLSQDEDDDNNMDGPINEADRGGGVRTQSACHRRDVSATFHVNSAEATANAAPSGRVTTRHVSPLKSRNRPVVVASAVTSHESATPKLFTDNRNGYKGLDAPFVSSPVRRGRFETEGAETAYFEARDVPVEKGRSIRDLRDGGPSSSSSFSLSRNDGGRRGQQDTSLSPLRPRKGGENGQRSRKKTLCHPSASNTRSPAPRGKKKGWNIRRSKKSDALKSAISPPYLLLSSKRPSRQRDDNRNSYTIWRLSPEEERESMKNEDFSSYHRRDDFDRSAVRNNRDGDDNFDSVNVKGHPGAGRKGVRRRRKADVDTSIASLQISETSSLSSSEEENAAPMGYQDMQCQQLDYTQEHLDSKPAWQVTSRGSKRSDGTWWGQQQQQGRQGKEVSHPAGQRQNSNQSDNSSGTSKDSSSLSSTVHHKATRAEAAPSSCGGSMPMQQAGNIPNSSSSIPNPYSNRSLPFHNGSRKDNGSTSSVPDLLLPARKSNADSIWSHVRNLFRGYSSGLFCVGGLSPGTNGGCGGSGWCDSSGGESTTWAELASSSPRPPDNRSQLLVDFLAGLATFGPKGSVNDRRLNNSNIQGKKVWAPKGTRLRLSSNDECDTGDKAAAAANNDASGFLGVDDGSSYTTESGGFTTDTGGGGDCDEFSVNYLLAPSNSSDKYARVPLLSKSNLSVANSADGVNIAVLDESHPQTGVKIHRASVLSDPSMLEECHYSGWDGRRSHYTVVAADDDSKDDEVARTPGRRWQPKPVLTVETREGRVPNPSEKSWRSPEVGAGLGDALAVVHVVPPPTKQQPRRHQNYRSFETKEQQLAIGKERSLSSSSSSHSIVMGDDERCIINRFLVSTSSEMDDEPALSPLSEEPPPELDTLPSSCSAQKDAKQSPLKTGAMMMAAAPGPGGQLQQQWASPMPPRNGRPPLIKNRSEISLSASAYAPPRPLQNATNHNRARTNTSDSRNTNSTAGTRASSSGGNSYHRRTNSTVFFSPESLLRICDSTVPRMKKPNNPAAREGCDAPVAVHPLKGPGGVAGSKHDSDLDSSALDPKRLNGSCGNGNNQDVAVDHQTPAPIHARNASYSSSVGSIVRTVREVRVANGSEEDMSPLDEDESPFVVMRRMQQQRRRQQGTTGGSDIVGICGSYKDEAIECTPIRRYSQDHYNVDVLSENRDAASRATDGKEQHGGDVGGRKAAAGLPPRRDTDKFFFPLRHHHENVNVNLFGAGGDENYKNGAIAEDAGIEEVFQNTSSSKHNDELLGRHKTVITSHCTAKQQQLNRSTVKKKKKKKKQQKAKAAVSTKNAAKMIQLKRTSLKNLSSTNVTITAEETRPVESYSLCCYLPTNPIFRRELRKNKLLGSKCAVEGWVVFSTGERCLDKWRSGVGATQFNVTRKDVGYLAVPKGRPFLYLFRSSLKDCISLDLSSQNVSLECTLISKRIGRCAVIYKGQTRSDGKTRKKEPLCCLLPAHLPPLFFEGANQVCIVGDKRFRKICSAMFAPFPVDATNENGKAKGSRGNKKLVWGDPGYLESLAPVEQNEAAVHIVFAIDSVIKPESTTIK